MEQSKIDGSIEIAKFMGVFMEVTMKPNEWQKGNSLLEVAAKYNEPFIYIPTEMRHISPSDNVDDIRNEALSKSWERVAWNAKYHTSWDWQIPSWSKIIKLSQQLAIKETDARRHNNLMDRYENAVAGNIPLDGFKIIVEAITWHSSTQKK